MKKRIPKNVIICGIICLTIIQIAAMFFGINGTLRTVIAVIIAGAMGLAIPTPKILKQ